MGEICNEYGVMVVADEIHHDLIQPGYKHIVYASLGKEFADNCVICTSLSKTFNLAGLCYASIIIPNDEVRAKFQKQMGLQAFMHIERFGPVAHEAAYRHGAEAGGGSSRSSRATTSMSATSSPSTSPELWSPSWRAPTWFGATSAASA